MFDRSTPYSQLEEEWHKRRTLIPAFSFPSSWLVAIIPPFGGATARFVCWNKPADSWVTFDREKARGVSVYLDFDHALGYYGADMSVPEPYWEIYPNAQGDNERFDLSDTDGMLGAIALSLAHMKENK